MNRARTIVGALLAAVAFGAAGAPAYADYHQIRNYGSGKCAGFNWWEYYANGATMVQQECNGSLEQQWAAIPVGTGWYRFVNARSGKCTDVRDGVNADWTPVQQWACASTAGQYWYTRVPVDVPVRIVSRIGGRCLDVRGGSLQDGAVIQIFHCTPYNSAQLWTIT